MAEVVQRLADLPRQFAEVPRRYAEEAPNQHPHLDILDLESVNRVTHLPLVASVLDYAQGVYESAKDSRVPLLGFALEAAEATAKYAVSQAQPVADFFEGPIHLVDTIACKGIDVLETAVPAVHQPADEVVKQARSYVAAKVQPTAELFSHAVELSEDLGMEAVHRGMDMAEGGVELAGAAKDVTMEAAGSLASAAKDTAKFGLEKTVESAAFGKEMAMESMRFGLEKAEEAVDFGLEKADRAIDFGREKALKAARSKYGQMAAKQLDKAAIMADTVTDMYMPPEVAADVRRRGQVDVKRRTEEWEPKLRPLGHSMAIGEKLFRKFLALFFWQFNMGLNVASFFMMPVLHPLKFADMVITQAFKAPPTIVNLANKAFNFWLLIMNPWKMSQAMFDVARGISLGGMRMLRNIILSIYFHYVPEEVVQTARQTRSKLEESKYTPPEFGRSVPQGRKRSEEASAGSGYHSEELIAEHREGERVPHHRMSLGGGEERKTAAHPGGKHVRGKQQRPTWDYMRRDEGLHHEQGQKQQIQQPLPKEQRKPAEVHHKMAEHHVGGRKEEAPSAVSKEHIHPHRKPKHEKAEESIKHGAGESQAKLKERQSEMENIPAQQRVETSETSSAEQHEKVPKETGEEQHKEEDKENLGSRLWSNVKEMVTSAGGLLEGEGGEEQREQPEEGMPKPTEEKREQHGQKPSEEGKGVGFTAPTPAGDVSAGVGGKLGGGEAKIEGSFSAPGLGEVSGKAGLERPPEEHHEAEAGEKKKGQEHVGGEAEHEIEIMRTGQEHPHGHHKGRHHHHHEKGIKEDFHKYEDLSHDENWVRENMPSVPVERKSPTHHDVVEEGVIPEALHELTDEEGAVPGTSSADFARGKGGKGQKQEGGKMQMPKDVGKEKEQHRRQEQGKVELASEKPSVPPASAPAPEEHGIGLGLGGRVEMEHGKQGGASSPYALHGVVGSPTAVEKTVD